MTATDRAPWVQIRGIEFHFRSPQPSEIPPIDQIAESLAKIPRFLGHTPGRMYTVADHCVQVAYQVDPGYRLWALAHELGESLAFGDIPGPVKQAIPEIRDIERRILQVCAARFGLEWPVPDVIKDADRRMLMTERAWFLDPFHPAPRVWEETVQDVRPYNIPRPPELSWKQSAGLFLALWGAYGGPRW